MIYLLSPLQKEGVYSLPMIDFETVFQEIDLKKYDILLFTSKQAVKTMDSLDPNWIDIPTICIGEATSKIISSKNGKILYQPKNFYAKDLAKDIIEKFKDKKILYIRPAVVSFDSKGFLLSEGLEIDEVIIYKTNCKRYDIHLDQNAIIIFTSPSTIRCFFKNFAWKSSYKAIVIGTSTKKHLAKNIEVYVSDSVSIESCIAKAKEILLSSNLK